MPGAHCGGNYLLFSGCFPERQNSQRQLSGNKGADWQHFPPLLLSINTEPPEGSSSVWTLAPKLLTPSPILLCSGGTALLSQGCLSPSVVGPSPRRPAQTLAHTTSPDQRFLQGFSSGGGGVRSHFVSRAEHTKLKLTTFRPGTKDCPQQARRAPADNWCEGQSSQNTAAECTQHT